MKCVVCHGENIEDREVKEPIEVGSDFLYVTVTTPVCETCGERYYDRKTVRYLEEVRIGVPERKARALEVAGRGTKAPTRNPSRCPARPGWVGRAPVAIP